MTTDKKEPVYTLTCTPPLYSALCEVLKVRAAKYLINRIGWDISRCPTFAVFCERAMKQNADEIVIFQKISTPEDFNDFMNTFLSNYTAARENYDITSSQSGSSYRTGTELRIMEPI